MPIWGWILCAIFCVPWAPKGEGPPLASARLAVFLWERLTETDAEKAQRLITKSQRLLEQARQLTADAQRASSAVDAEFERRLRIVSGDRGRTD